MEPTRPRSVPLGCHQRFSPGVLMTFLAKKILESTQNSPLGGQKLLSRNFWRGGTNKCGVIRPLRNLCFRRLDKANGRLSGSPEVFTYFRELVQTDRQCPMCKICSRPDKGLGPSTRRTCGNSTDTASSAVSNTIRASAFPCFVKKMSNNQRHM